MTNEPRFPPSGWYYFGTHAGWDHVPPMIFSDEKDEVFDPLWEKPVTRMQQIAQEIVQHYKDNPSHGVGCVCMDEYSRELKREFKVTPFWLHEEPPHVMKGARALNAILSNVARDLYHYQSTKCTCPSEPWAKPNDDCPLHRGGRRGVDWG